MKDRPSGYMNFDFHGRIGVRVAAGAPAALQLRTMLAGFHVDHDIPADIVVTGKPTDLHNAAQLEDELRYTERAVRMVQAGVQLEFDPGQVTIQGTGELLTTLLPLLDRSMVAKGAAMIHAATVDYNGRAVALPAAGGTGKTSTIAKLLKRPGFSFMGDDWAFLADDSSLLGFEKPMFIKPHHRKIYPHLFEGSRKPMVPVWLSRPVGRLTTKVHPYFVQRPKLADLARRWSPEHRIVRVDQALPGVTVTHSAPLLMAVYLERYDGARTRLEQRDPAWMVDRMIGNFHIEMPTFSRDVLAALAATSLGSLSSYFEDKAAVLTKALDDRPCYVLRVPGTYTPDVASDDIVRAVEELLAAPDGGRTHG